MICFLIILCSTIPRITGQVEEAICNIYKKKLGVDDPSLRVGSQSLAFTGFAEFIDLTANIRVSLRYSDNKFEDNQYFGLTKEDGKQINQTCLELKLWRFKTSNYSDPIQVTNTSLIPSNDTINKWRYLSYSIDADEFNNSLVLTLNSNEHIYLGYYALSYYLTNQTQTLYVFYFSFAVIMNRKNQEPKSINFYSFNQYETSDCQLPGSCQIKPSTSLNLCMDLNCTNITVESILLQGSGDYIKQEVLVDNLREYYLVNTSIYFIGNGINKLSNSIYGGPQEQVQGQYLAMIGFGYLWNNVTLLVQSYLSNSSNQSDGILYDPVFGKIDFECVTIYERGCQWLKLDFVFCDYQCETQSFANDGCPTCKNSYLVIFFTFILIWIF